MPAYTKDNLAYHHREIPEGMYNLMGWSPTDGFLQNLIEKAKAAPERANFIAFYADNLYVSSVKNGKVKWLSLDGEKMECSHDYEDFD
jgi:hypothetical protein